MGQIGGHSGVRWYLKCKRPPWIFLEAPKRWSHVDSREKDQPERMKGSFGAFGGLRGEFVRRVLRTTYLKRLNHQNVNFCVFHIFGVSPDLRMAKNTVNFPGGLVMERRWDTSLYRMLVYPCVWVLSTAKIEALTRRFETGGCEALSFFPGFPRRPVR